MKDRIKELAKEFHADAVRIRRHLHQHPELSFNEVETSKFVCGELDRMGIEYQTGYVETGIVAHIKGNDPGSRTIALRADLDALPIQEANDVEYRSVNEGVMHACGHDVHTTSLLGAARILNEIKGELHGTIKLVFQPGEEKLPGGASLMIEQGALKGPDAEKILGQHVYPELEVGKVGFRAGKYMASTDEIYITVNGKGGHAALPQYNVDPVMIASRLLIALQDKITEIAKENVPYVLAFGKVTANGATNVIPDQVKIEGTFRTMEEEWRTYAHEQLQVLAHSICEEAGGSCDMEIRKGYPFLVNDETLTNSSIEAAREFLGAENVIDLDLRMTAEDFSYYSQVIPGCFYRLGIRNDDAGINSGLHTDTFDVDERCLETGMGLMAWLAVKELS